MKNKKLIVVIAVIAIIISIILFIQKSKTQQTTNNKQQTTVANQVEYYTCGMHPSVRVSPEEYDKGNVNCPICNMKLVPVYAEAKAKQKQGEKKILFYRNPMDPSITSEVPTKDSMGMDYIPVYEETDQEGSYYGCGMEGAEHIFLIQGVEGMTKCPVCGMPLKKLSKQEADKLKGVVSRVKINGGQAALAGVMTEPVKSLSLFKEIRTVGRVAYDPELAVAQEEFISALRAMDKIEQGRIAEIKERAEGLVESSRKKLMLLGLSDEQIEKLKEGREVHDNLILPEKKMWIYGNVYEYELSWVKTGTKVEVAASGVPGEVFDGVISSINPVLDPNTRSVIFRAEVNNPSLNLKPQMYVDVIIESNYTGPGGEKKVLAIPKDAVLDTGKRKIVWVDKGSGEYEGRAIEAGPEATAIVNGEKSKFYPVLKGLAEGEMVVTKANFLIDSQSQLSSSAAAAYGGSLSKDEETQMPVSHQH